jgi:hypothetical protein
MRIRDREHELVDQCRQELRAVDGCLAEHMSTALLCINDADRLGKYFLSHAGDILRQVAMHTTLRSLLFDNDLYDEGD